MAISDQLCSPDDPNGPKWSTWQILKWKFLPERFGGGWPSIFRFKYAWVAYNRQRITNAAAGAGIPAILLAGVAWIEVGGDPLIVDDAAFFVRSFDWSGPNWVDRHLTITRRPELTSFGNVSIQLRRAMEVLHIAPGSLTFKGQEQVALCLQHDAFNLPIVAKYLRQMVNVDFVKADSLKLTDDQIAVVATRYNRGPDLTLAQIRQNMSYGKRLLSVAAKLKTIIGS